jgi:hypothetical protein
MALLSAQGLPGGHSCQFPLVRRHGMRNGVGKTTTVRILGTLITATSGSAAVAGIQAMQAHKELQVLGHSQPPVQARGLRHDRDPPPARQRQRRNRQQPVNGSRTSGCSRHGPGITSRMPGSEGASWPPQHLSYHGKGESSTASTRGRS